MKSQDDFRMPQKGEAWREETESYPNLFTIIGMASDVVTGAPMVIYTEYESMDHVGPPIFACRLDEFMKLVPGKIDKSRMAPRFRFDREAPDDPRSPYIRPGRGLTLHPSLSDWISA